MERLKAWLLVLLFVAIGFAGVYSLGRPAPASWRCSSATIGTPACPTTTASPPAITAAHPGGRP